MSRYVLTLRAEADFTAIRHSYTRKRSPRAARLTIKDIRAQLRIRENPEG